MAAQYELLKELLNSGTPLSFGQNIFFKFYQAFILKDRWLQYINGVGTTLLVTAIALVLGVVLGAIVAMVRVGYAQQKPHHRNPILGVLNAVCQVYVTVIRGVPVVVLLLIFYFIIMTSAEGITVGILTFGINSGAYMSEVFRSGIQSIDRGQTEAARSLGLSSRQTMMRIVLPQAFKNVLPAMCNEFVTIIKETSILGMVGIVELMFRAQSIAKQTYIFLEPYVIAAIMYFIIVFPLSKIIAAVERRMSKSVTR